MDKKILANINKAVLQGQNLEILKEAKTPEFYKYLLQNNVAYYYSTKLSNGNTDEEKRIIAIGNKFNEKYHKTLRVLHEIAHSNKLEFILFKTVKRVPEAVDGDIDMVVKREDFYRWLELLENHNYVCTDEGGYKAHCIHPVLSKVEPRTNASAFNFVLLDEKEIWNHAEEFEEDGIKVNTTTNDVDVFKLLLNVIYGPKYTRLYLFALTQLVSRDSLLNLTDNKMIQRDLNFILDKLEKIDIENTKFPYFLDNFSFLGFFVKSLLPNKHFSYNDKIRHFVFFFYMKYKYIFLGKLHFEHEWK